VAQNIKPVRDGDVKAPAAALRPGVTPGEFPGQSLEAKGKKCGARAPQHR
jgi:hypothetical protein